MYINVTEASKIYGHDLSGQDGTGGHNENFMISDDILQWDYIPGEGYCDDDLEFVVYQYDMQLGMERHRGITQGCFWTDWE